MSGQAIQFEFRLDEGEFAALTQKLHELSGDKARTYIARALNKTAVSARVKLVNRARARYTVKSKGFKQEMKIRKAHAGNTVALLESQGAPLSIKEFKYSFSRPNPVNVAVVNTGLKPLVKYGNKAFVGKGNLGGHIYVRTGKAAKKYKGIAVEDYAKRTGKKVPKNREGLEKIFSKSVPYMLGNDGYVWVPSEPEIKSDLKKFMQQQIKQLVG